MPYGIIDGSVCTKDVECSMLLLSLQQQSTYSPLCKRALAIAGYDESRMKKVFCFVYGVFPKSL